MRRVIFNLFSPDEQRGRGGGGRGGGALPDFPPPPVQQTMSGIDHRVK